MGWLRGVDLNHRPLGYEPNELPDCSTPRSHHNNRYHKRQTARVTACCDACAAVEAVRARSSSGFVESWHTRHVGSA